MKTISIFIATFGIFGLLLLQSFKTNTEIPMLHFNQDDYAAEWRAIDSLEQQGLPKSALEKVNALYERAKSEKNEPQYVKTVIFRAKYTKVLEEDGLVKAIQQMEMEAEQADFPVKNILQSTTAELYQQYLDNNYWRFKDRTNIATDTPNEDIKTWTIAQFIDKANLLYQSSLESPDLKRVKNEDFEVLLKDGKLSEGLRPTLYDILAHRALEHFMNERSYLTEPAYKFYLDDPSVFENAKTFANTTYTAKDISANKYQTLVLLQELTKAHLKDKKSEALIDVNLKRLQFMYDNAVVDDKATLYLAALDELYAAHKRSPMASEVLYKKASYYNQKGQSYTPNPDDKGKWDRKTARDLLQTAIKDYPKSYGATLCQNLLFDIERKDLRFQTEQVNLPNRPFLALVEHRNIKRAYLRVVALDAAKREKLDYLNPKEKLAYLKKQNTKVEWTVNLPNDGDFNSHSIELKVAALPLGTYAILLSDTKAMEDEVATSFLITAVSNIAYWERKNNDDKTEFIVVDRETGEPMEGVTAEFFGRDYDRVLRKNKIRSLGTALTDARGFVTANPGDTRSFQVKFSKGKDELFFSKGYSNYSYDRTKDKQLQTHFFLDRAIYRPSQTVYFKGIVLEKDLKGIPTIVANQEVEVNFIDANYQNVETLKLKTNEYGTVNGSFTAPSSGLLGKMYIKSSAGDSQKEFRVEEYKRPKFAVDFEPVTESYRLEDIVKVEGFAKAFAGNNVDGAKVQYRVVREVRYPWIPWWYRRYYNTGASMEIKNGVTETDAEGKFSIEFPALADKEADATRKPAFHYTIYADVVDITGETRSSKTIVKVGHIALEVGLDIAERIELDKFKELKIATKNLNGEFEAATGIITIQALKQPEKLYVARYWDAPEQQLLSKDAFTKTFPNLAYKDENEIQNWAKGKQLLSQEFNTANGEQLDISKTNWKAGSYILTLKTKDKYGQAVELEKHFTLYDMQAEKVPFAAIGWQMQDKGSYQPKEKANIYLGTATKNLKVLFEVERDGKIIRQEWVDVKDVKRLTQAIEEQDRGNLHAHFSYVKYNRSFNETQTILVPWTNKELKIEYATFRDKLSPGQEEEWQIKISGPKGEKVAAEMVAGLYDASLDQFVGHSWGLNPYPTAYAQKGIRAAYFNPVRGRQIGYYRPSHTVEYRSYQQLDWFGFNNYRGGRGDVYMSQRSNRTVGSGMKRSKMSAPPEMAEMSMDAETASYKVPIAEEGVEAGAISINESPQPQEEPKADLSNVPIRKNLKETVFFFPNLKTDKDGNIIIKFTMNEALTKWKFLGLAHTKDLKLGATENTTVTQKELMVQPNAPRFLREGDEIVFTAKVSNMTETAMAGNARIELLDATTMQPVEGLFGLKNSEANFTAAAGQSARLAWTLKVPSVAKVPALVHRVVAKAGNFSDGEESTLPILTNRMLVTETMPLPIRGKKKEDFTFASLQNSGASSTLEHQSLTLEFTSNPAWYAVQALPYLMEYPHECIEQVFSRYYANSLATSVANSHPKVKEVFEIWKTKDTEALQSNLSKNQELKYALLEETPWVLNAQNEEVQKRNIGLLFDLTKMAEEQGRALDKIIERQAPNGGFAWFKGGKESWYMTQYLLEGLGHLDKLGVQSIQQDARVVRLIDNAIRFVDEELVKHYNRQRNYELDQLDPIVIHYLYTRSFFRQYPIEGNLKKVVDYYLGQGDKFWLQKSTYQQGMLALAMQRVQRTETPAKIVKSLKERAINHPELGMYWKYDNGYYWYQLPVETHALMIEVFSEVAKDSRAVEELKVWLLKAKQTTHWKTTKSTAAAVYALLMNGDNWLLEDKMVEVNFDNAGNPEIHEAKLKHAQQNAEAGTGYYKAHWTADEITADMATVRVENPNKNVAWGGLYWQYFEQLDKITTFEETPLQLKKQLYKEVNSPTGPKLEALSEGAVLEPGDKLKVRIEIRVDRAMEYVHMKDARASGFEPINVLSQYKWNGGLGYYESTRDASTNFFFSYLPKGTHVFEYPLRVVHEGDFSNGVTTIQCMYAPEFTSHSEGIRVNVE